jgi:DNA-3-methyladenine glycosylase II
VSAAASKKPTIRRGIAGACATSFSIRLPGPIDIPSSLESFRRSGDDLLDRWDGANLVRVAPSAADGIAYHCQARGTVNRPVLSVAVADPAHRTAADEAVRSMFVAAPPEFEALLRADPVIARLNARYPGFRQVRHSNLLTALVRCISAQQVNLRWAATTRRRLADAFGEKHQVGSHFVHSLSAERLAAAQVSQIRALQFTTRKAEFLIGVAEAVASGRIDLASLAALPDDEVIARLTALRGIGVWTAEWILARTLGRPRVVAGDLGVRKAVGMAYQMAMLPSEAEVRRLTTHWGPSAGAAQALLLHALSQGVLSTKDIPVPPQQSPLPRTRGRGQGEGAQRPARKRDVFCKDADPLAPAPLPRVRGRGETPRRPK